VNFATRITTRADPLRRAPAPLIARLYRHPGSRSRRWCAVIPACEKVNALKAPTANRGIRRSMLAPSKIVISEARQARARIPADRARRHPLRVNIAGRKPSLAAKLDRRGKSEKEVSAAKIRMPMVVICTKR